MKKQILSLIFLAYFSTLSAQISDDKAYKEAIYKKSKIKVLNYTVKTFDELFVEFANKRSDVNILLTKEEFYDYTTQISAYSERLAKLYPDQQEVALKNKENWYDKEYQEYLEYKKTQKK